MIITNPIIEVVYFKLYNEYFEVPRNKTTPHATLSSYCRKTDRISGTYFLEHDFYISDDFTKEPFFVYRTKYSFNFVVENKEKDLDDLGLQKADFRSKTMSFIENNTLNYVFEHPEHIFPVHNDLSLVIGQGFYD